MSVPAPRPRLVRPLRDDSRQFSAWSLEEGDPLLLALLGLFTLAAATFVAWTRAYPLPDPEPDYDVVVALIADLPPVVIRLPDPLLPAPLLPEPARPVDLRRPERPSPAPRDAPVEPPSAAAGAPSPGREGHRPALLDHLDELAQIIGSDGDRVIEAAGRVRNLEETAAAAPLNTSRSPGRVGVPGDQEVGIGGTGGRHGETGTEVAVRPVIRAVPSRSASTAASDPDSDDRALQEGIAAQQRRISSCAENVLKANPGFEARVEVAWRVDAGKVSGVRLLSPLGDAGMEDCVVRAVRLFRFPPTVTTTVEGYTWIVSGR